MSSLAAVIPAPTRSIYASSKAASLLLYQALSIEHPTIKFSMIIPSTVKGDFRASAVDGGPVWESTSMKGLDKGYVARKSVEAIDYGKKVVFLPGYHGFSHHIYWFWPSFVEGRAREKYNFVPKTVQF
jgi:short-subunit dehydrogenase